MKRALILSFVALASVAVAAAEEKLGAGVTLTEVTAIADVVKNPEAFAGKTIRIDGVATAVCEKMGCWLALSETDTADAPTIRLKVEHGAIVFPTSAKGKQVSAQGVFEKIGAGDAEAKEAAAEHAKHHAAEKTAEKPAATHAHGAAPAATAAYQLKATGAIIR